MYYSSNFSTGSDATKIRVGKAMKHEADLKFTKVEKNMVKAVSRNAILLNNFCGRYFIKS